ncbi:MAB_1171c family putative transporter [Streptomyces sp. NPDC055992]|uniref:MAB_1171c family putative transporter n=1 Tax=Streptomyces sp. NPDC055992 TaxID=3345673 RepID=UPI0035D67010
MNILFLGMALVLALASFFWVISRGTTRPAGTWAVGALLGSFALAFVSYAPVFERTVEGLVPHVARLISNSASLAAATAVLAVSVQLNLDRVSAARRIRVRLVVLATAVLGMTGLFVYEQISHQSAQAYALYLLLYVTCLAQSVVGFLAQALRQATTTRRRAVRTGLRTAAVGCGFALLYLGYKTLRLVDLGLGLGLIGEHSRCSSLAATRCMFSVTAPALAVLLICLGLTLPAVAYPLSQRRRRHWEADAVQALDTLWRDLTAAMPHIVLAPVDDVSDDTGFALQRRVIEISDGVLALRPYRSRRAHEAARKTLVPGAGPEDAALEAAIVKAALADLAAGQPADDVIPLPATTPGRGNLREEAEWLLGVARAYTKTSGCVTEGTPSTHVGG